MTQPLCINSSYCGTPEGYPLNALTDAKRAGFSHVMWAHHWNTDFIYTEPEIQAVASHLQTLGMAVEDIHGSIGVEKSIYSPVEYERLAGVELVKNRIEMTSILDGEFLVLHPCIVHDEKLLPVCREQGLRSLMELESFALSRGVRIALENLFRNSRTKEFDTVLENYDTIEYYLERFESSYLGFCWDTGHCILLGDESFKRAERIALERLCMVHLTDNQGDYDRHSPPFTWSGIWERIAEVIASSPYRRDKPFTLEVNAKNNGNDHRTFLSEVHEKGLRFIELFERCCAQ